MSDPAVAEITALPTAGPLRVRVTIPNTPHNLAAVLWRYDANQHPVSNTPTGEFSRTNPSVPIGSIGSVRGNYFMVEGAVLNNGDNPPVRYQVEITILQGDTTLHEDVPPEGGSGQISNTDQSFVYRFHITAP